MRNESLLRHGKPRTRGVHLRQLSLSEVDSGTMEAWASLAQHALEPNAYLCPEFLLPCVRHLRSGPEPLILAVESADTGARLLGIGVFRDAAGNKHFPLPHLAAYRERHSFLTGFLVSREACDEVLDALFAFVASGSSRWHGLAFEERDGEGQLDRALRTAAARAGTSWVEHASIRRACLGPAELQGDPLQRLPGRTRRELARQERRLRESGHVEWRLLRGSEVGEAAVTRFLELEHRGWKGENGSSLLSRERDRRFFEDAVQRFRRRDGVFFTELVVDGRVIASTSNFLCGRTAFAFKIAWDKDYAAYSPGVLNEVFGLREGSGFLRSLRFFDSGADEGSFVERLWPGRRLLSSGVFPGSNVARAALKGVTLARSVRRQILHHRNH